MQGLVRSTAWLAFFAAILAAWAMMYIMATGMGLDLLGRPDAMAQSMRHMDPGMDMDMPMARFGPLFAMWAIMMAAMMGPTLVPTLRAYEDLMHSASGTRAGWWALLAGYFAVWISFAAAIAALQVMLLHGGVIDMLGIARQTWVQAVMLIVVGAFQFTRIKEICHGVCHAPTIYFLGHWRPGAAGGARMGVALGAYCAVCCWGFMLLGFVGGVMNLAWMGLATLFMVMEKLPQIGHRVTKPMGAVLIAAGVAVWIAPTFLGG